MSFILVLLFVQGIQSLVLAIFLVFTRRGKKISNLYLAGFLFTLVVEIAYAFVARYTDLSLDILAYFGFLYGPFLLFYIQSLNYTNHDDKANWKLHGTPIFCFVFATFVGRDSGFFEGFLAVCFGYYFVVSFNTFLRTKRILKANYSNLDIVDIGWLSTFLVPFFPLILVDSLKFLFDFTDSQIFSMGLVFLQALIFLFIINYLTIAGWMKTNSFMGIYENFERIPIDKSTAIRSYKDDFNQQQISRYAKHILDKVERDELFKNPEMNIQTLAEKVGMSPRHVSHTINLYFNTNFSDFINKRRLMHAKYLLVSFSNHEKNISQIIFESGFNSTTSFYTYFKKNEGSSPKAYRLSHRKGQ